MRRIVLIVAATEIALFLATRLILSYWSAWEWQAELLRSLFRLGAAFVFWYFFRGLIFSAVPALRKIGHPSSMIAICLFLAVPFLVGNWDSLGPLSRIVFAATSIIVALHEEFLFRGIVQNLLASRWGMVTAIVLTSALATVWHLPALPLNVFNFLQVFIASCILGLIYARTRSMLLMVSLHALYDAIWSLTPVLREPLSWYWGAGLLVLALLFTAYWAARDSALDADAPRTAGPSS